MSDLCEIEVGYKVGPEIAEQSQAIAREFQADQIYDRKRGLGYPDYHLAPTAEVLKLMGYTQPCDEAVAWLHDIFEDTEATKEEIVERGIPKFIVDMAYDLRRDPEEDYRSEYIPRLGKSDKPCVAAVKAGDSVTNLSYLMNRLGAGEVDDVDIDLFRLNRYLKNYVYLRTKLTRPDHVLWLPADEQRAGGAIDMSKEKLLSDDEGKALSVCVPILIGRWPVDQEVGIAA